MVAGSVRKSPRAWLQSVQRTGDFIITEGRETAFNIFVVPGYYWKAVEKQETDPQLL
jgi:hypothetical protein